MHLLGAPDGGGGEFFVDSRLELDVMSRQMPMGLPECLVQPAERRTPVAGNVAGGVKARRRVALALDEGKANERLNAGQVNPTAVRNVLVVQGNCLHVRLL